MNSAWHHSPLGPGWMVIFRTGEGEVTFWPDQYGRIRSVGCTGGLVIDLRKLEAVALNVRKQLPETRFGTRHSSARGILCGRICSALNGAGIRPEARSS